MQKLRKRKQLNALIILSVISIILIYFFVSSGLTPNNFNYSFPRRIRRVVAIIFSGSAIVIASLIFQTIANNNILTPGVMGLDSLYQFIQTFIVFAFGSRTLTTMTSQQDFILSCTLMMIFSIFLYKLVFKNGNRNIFTLVLVGMVFGSFFGSLSSFMQALIDPNEFLIVQGRMFASFNSVNTDLLTISIIIITTVLLYSMYNAKKLDVISLGREHSINLGINYDREVLVYLMIVSILTSVSTALVGPITFLGILIVNLTRQLFKTHKHSLLSLGSSIIALIALIGGQFLVERVFSFDTTVSIIINLFGGIYFIFLLLKERTKA